MRLVWCVANSMRQTKRGLAFVPQLQTLVHTLGLGRERAEDLGALLTRESRNSRHGPGLSLPVGVSVHRLLPQTTASSRRRLTRRLGSIVSQLLTSFENWWTKKEPYATSTLKPINPI